MQPLARPSWPCNMSRRSPLILGTICRTDKDGRTDGRIAEGRPFEDAMRIESEQLFFLVIVYQRPPSLNDAAAPAPIISYIILSPPSPRRSFSPLYPSFPIISGAALHCLLFDVIYDMAYIPSSTVPPLSFGLQNEY